MNHSLRSSNFTEVRTYSLFLFRVEFCIFSFCAEVSICNPVEQGTSCLSQLMHHDSGPMFEAVKLSTFVTEMLDATFSTS